jgi:type IV pilus assembly protein PilB
MFLASFKYKASDIHIEPNEKNVNIRFRVDGHFVEYKEVDLLLKDQIIARLKIMSSLKIDENRLPQD